MFNYLFLSHFQKVVKEEYAQKQALLGHTQPVEFASDKITLNIPMEGTFSAGWTISPLFPPVVSTMYCKAGNFRLEKIFAFYAPYSHGRNFYPQFFCPMLVIMWCLW